MIANVPRSRTAIAAIGLGMAVAAGAFGLARIASDAWRPYTSAPAALRMLLGLVWCGAQVAMVGAAYIRSHRSFAAMLTAGLVIGLIVMTVGRSGLSASAIGLLLLLLPIVILLGAGASRVSRLSEEAGPTHEVRLLLVLAASGVVYLFSTRVFDGLAQVAALGAVLIVLGILAALQSRVRRTVVFLDKTNAHRLGVLLWALSGLLLLVNVAAIRETGAVTPQVGLPVAPYQLAAVIILVSVAIIWHSRRPTWLMAVVHVLCLGSCVVMMAAVDFGTLAVLLIGIAVVLSGGSIWRLTVVVVGIMVMVSLARGPLATPLVHHLPARASARIAAWAGLTGENEQLVRVRQTLALSGLTGEAGAGRTNFLVGQAAGKDYAAAVVAAQGGIAGLLIVVLQLLSFLVELFRRLNRLDGAAANALCAGVLALFVANALVATLWMNNTTPLIGIPAPLFARAGSHLTVAALAVGLVTFGTGRSVHAEA